KVARGPAPAVNAGEQSTAVPDIRLKMSLSRELKLARRYLRTIFNRFHALNQLQLGAIHARFQPVLSSIHWTNITAVNSSHCICCCTKLHSAIICANSGNGQFAVATLTDED